MTYSRRGVSLIELLIAVTVVTIIAASMTKLMVTNSRADEVKNAQREARGVSRASINLLESELRMVDPFGVIAPTDDSTLTVRVPYAFGLVCVGTGGGATVSFLPSFELSGSLNTGGHAGWAWRDVTSAYVYEATTTISAGSASTCTTAQISNYTAEGGVVAAFPAPSATIKPGTVAFAYRLMTYSLRESTTYPGRRALYRTAGAGGAPEELAAPFSTTSRFRFYIGNDLLPTDTIPTFLDNLRGIQFVLNGESVLQARSSASVARAPFVTAVFFQNRPS
jgi:prepilin-type N-terminal cleavage/methylation domain-containing protein